MGYTCEGERETVYDTYYLTLERESEAIKYPAVDVQDEVHLERLGFTMQAAHSVELLSFGIDILDVKYVLKQHAGHPGDFRDAVSRALYLSAS